MPIVIVLLAFGGLVLFVWALAKVLPKAKTRIGICDECGERAELTGGLCPTCQGPTGGEFLT
jgi:predicted amidophosphoribosyltransferase